MDFFLSLEAMVDLGLVNRESSLFPYELRGEDGNENVQFSSNCCIPEADGSRCSCALRGGAPTLPDVLPFEPCPKISI